MWKIASNLNDFNLLKEYQPSYLKYNPINKRLNKFQNRLVIFKENYNKNNDFDKAIKYFKLSVDIR